ncbi:MAG: Maf family nucleotide pyrophosphatase [Pseudoxanthomonas sp.]
MQRLILGSTSVYRRELLARLRLPFEVARPEVDGRAVNELALPGEPPRELAVRLAQAKAHAVAARQADDAWALGSDQVAELDGQALGKPGGRDAAIAQLQAMRGRRVRFHTALCLAHVDGRAFAWLDLTEVHFRVLDDAEIARYVDAETPYDCAGSFKSEGLGISLFERIDSIDPTALVGLPLIATCRLLRQAGFALP